MATVSLRNQFLATSRGFSLVDTTTVTWSFDTATNTLSALATTASNAITNAKLDDMAQATIKGRPSGAGTGDPADLTAAQVKTILNLASSDISNFTEAAQDAALGAVGNTARIAFTYDDAGNTLTADVVAASLDNSKLAVMAQSTLKGRAAGGGTGAAEDLTASQARTLLLIDNVENTALSTWAGSASITALGTVATGSWNATAIADGKIASALTGKTYNGLTLTSAAVGFTLSGGATSKTLTVPLDATVSGTNTGDQSGANPSASTGLSAVNGSALTFMRSDASTSLSQAISPNWTGNHTFTPSSGLAILINGGSANGLTISSSGATAPIKFTPSGQDAWTVAAGVVNVGDFGVINATQSKNVLVFTGGSSGGDATFIAGVKTAAPNGAAGLWKLGVTTSGVALALNTTSYVEISIAGTVVKLAQIL